MSGWEENVYEVRKFPSPKWHRIIAPNKDRARYRYCQIFMTADERRNPPKVEVKFIYALPHPMAQLKASQ